MKKLALLCAVALFLTACHCERRTTGTPCRKGQCQVQAVQKRAAHKKAAAKRAAQRRAAAAKRAAEQRAAQQESHYAAIGQAHRRGNVISVSYRDPILFRHNSDQINPVSNRELNRTAALLKKYPENSITINGYTDSTGNAAYNVDLSQRRAKAVADALIERGVPASQVSYHGFGAANPVAPNNTAAGRAKNRRVELEIHVK